MATPTSADAIKLLLEANRFFTGTTDIKEVRRFFQDAKDRGVISDFEEPTLGTFRVAVPLEMVRVKVRIRTPTRTTPIEW